MIDNVLPARVWPILISLMEQFVAPVFSGRLSKDVAGSIDTFPRGVYQSQDAGGKNDNYIGQNGWKGEVTIRAMDITQSGAYNKAQQAASAALGFTHSSYDISVTIDRPITFPVEKITQGSVYTAGIVLALGIQIKT